MSPKQDKTASTSFGSKLVVRKEKEREVYFHETVNGYKVSNSTKSTSTTETEEVCGVLL